MTMTNEEKLNAIPGTLAEVYRQDQFLLHMATERIPCGRCGHGHSQIEALNLTSVNDYNLNEPDRAYRCPATDTPIKYVVPFIGSRMFFADLEKELEELDGRSSFPSEGDFGYTRVEEVDDGHLDILVNEDISLTVFSREGRDTHTIKMKPGDWLAIFRKKD